MNLSPALPLRSAFFHAGESPQIAGVVERCYRIANSVVRVRQVRFVAHGPFTDRDAAAMDARVRDQLVGRDAGGLR